MNTATDANDSTPSVQSTIAIGPDNVVRLSLAAPAIIDEILSEISPELGLPVSSNQMFNALGTGRHRTGHDNSDLHDPEMLRLFSSMLGAEST